MALAALAALASMGAVNSRPPATLQGPQDVNSVDENGPPKRPCGTIGQVPHGTLSDHEARP